MAYTPAGNSIYNFIHYAQMIITGEFSLFDYDNEQTNQRIYGQSKPPLYNLTKITAPVNLYYSNGDDTATIENAIHLQKELPNIKSSYLVPIDDFCHDDFIFSIIAKEFVYKQLIDNINKANGVV